MKDNYELSLHPSSAILLPSAFILSPIYPL
jgi:hypothetical protein